MGTYFVSILGRAKIRARSQEEAEQILGLLVKALEKAGVEVTIDGFEVLPKA